jgi:fructosamine-3-kinase
VLVQAGAALARLHSIRTEGFGPLDPTGRGEGVSWADFVPDRAALPQLLAAAARAGFDQADVTEAVERLEVHRPFWEVFWARTAPRLLHGDLKPQHIMVSDGRFAGFIDFEFPHSGDPAADLAHWDYYHGDALPTAWLLEGYGPALAADKSWPTRRLLHRVQHSLSKLRWHGLRDAPGSPFLELVRVRLSHDLQDLRRAGRCAGQASASPGRPPTSRRQRKKSSNSETPPT